MPSKYSTDDKIDNKNNIRIIEHYPWGAYSRWCLLSMFICTYPMPKGLNGWYDWNHWKGTDERLRSFEELWYHVSVQEFGYHSEPAGFALWYVCDPAWENRAYVPKMHLYTISPPLHLSHIFASYSSFINI